MSLFSVKAPLKLDIIIVGGGVSGLAAAFRLTRAGHKVHVIEKSGPEQKACGVRVPPNLTKILVEWGLGEQLSQCGKPTTGSQCYSMETGELVGHLVWQEAVIEEIGAEYLLMHYQDLHAMLYSAAKSAGIQISYNMTVTKVSANPPRVELASGRTLYADLVIGADGSHSIVREAVEGKENVGQSDNDSFSVYVATIPREELQKDPELNAFTTPELGGPQYPIWMGTSCHAVAFAVRDDSEFTLHVFWPDHLIDTDDDPFKEWDVMIPREKLRISGDPKLRRLLDLCPKLQRRRYIRRDLPSEWTDESGRIVLMGEAAHPSLPCITHSASLQVEDAEVLGWLLSRLHSWEQLPHLLEAFQDIRQERCRTVHEKEYMGFQLVWLPPGPYRDARDETLRAIMMSGLQGWDEENMRWQWEEISEVIGYNAREAAENWWVSWGMLRERSQPYNTPLSSFSPIQVGLADLLGQETMVGS
ncbi:FAD/NAD(P)-binding domain-containing protein [Gyrodon lividus]|nr:FAD/NAD(P)-binding domain-containing protein [Gyrodon lividus]